MTTPGKKAFGAFRFVAKTKGTFDVWLSVPLNIPMVWKSCGVGIMVATDAEHGNRTALTPRRYLVLKAERKGLGIV